MKIYVSPSSQRDNRYTGVDTNEQDVCFEIAQKLCTELLSSGFAVRMPRTKDTTYAWRVDDSNSFGADLHIAIHTNAGGGDGTVVFCHPSRITHPYVTSIYDSVAALTPGEDDGIRPMTNLYEINRTDALCVYVECEFHDNAALASWIKRNTGALAYAIASGIKAVNAPQQEPSFTGQRIYRVYSGSYRALSNARAQEQALAKQGVDSFVTQSREFYRVQIGAFESEENAKAFRGEMLDKGIDCFIE